MRAVSILVLCLLSCLPFVAAAQTEGAPEVAVPEPPAIESLAVRWWEYFDAANADAANRHAAFLALNAGQLPQLSPKARDEAQSLLDSVRSNLAIYLDVAQTAPPSPESLPAAADEYSLDQLLRILGATRTAGKLVLEDELEVSRAKRQRDTAAARRDVAFKNYINAAAASGRWLEGLRLVQARSQLAIADERLQLFTRDFESSREFQRGLQERLNYARERLQVPGDEAAVKADTARLEQAQAALDAARAELDATQVAAADIELNTDIGKASQRVQERAVLRARVEVAVREIELAQAEAQIWLTYLSGDYSRSRLIKLEENKLEWRSAADDIQADAELWQTEIEEELLLIQSAATDGLNPQVRKLLNERGQIARDTLTRLGVLDDAASDLRFMITLLEDATVRVAGRYERFFVSAFGALREWSGSLLEIGDTTLFNIGESPVTGDDLLWFLMVIIFAVVLSRLVRKALNSVGTSKFTRDTSTLYTFGRLFHYVIITLAIFVGLAGIGIDFSSLAIVAGALGVGIGFGLQSIVNNFVSGLIILFEQTLRVGDYIELDTGVTGTVKDISVRSTLINTNDNIDIIVPNAEIVSNKLTNWTLGEYILRVRIPFGVAYGTDKELVKKAAIEATDNVSYTLTHMKGREPDVWLVEFGDNSLNFLLLVWVNRQGARRPTRTRAAYLWELDSVFKKYGIEVPFPQRDLHLRSGWPPEEDREPL